MKFENRLIDRATFLLVWFAIGTISTAIAATFVVGLKTIFGF